jgi:filamentous hemagglutinin family protein
MRQWQQHPILVVLSLVGGVSFVTLAKVNSIEAQIVPDRTLGSESSRVTPNVTIKGLPSDRIDGGAIRGVNLFHSFQDFNIGSGRGAYFANPNGIANILTRVTGSNASNILGTLGVLGNANLFLINPNGIVFGPSARLDLRGSFLGSTASSVVFDNNFEFSATNPQALPLLTINIPTGLRFRDNPGTIVNRSQIANSAGELVGLQVQPGKTLALLGGDIIISGGGLNALGGRIELGGLSKEGSIELDASGNTLKFSFLPSGLKANINLTDEARASVRGLGGGDIVVNANSFTATNGGRLVAGTESVGNAGNITVNANEVKLSGVGINGFRSGLYNQVLPDALGNAGNIAIATRSFNMSSDAVVRADTAGKGNGGDVTIQSTNDISLSGRSFITTASVGQGNAGNVIVQANGLISLINASIDSSVLLESLGKGGYISIRARSLTMTDDSSLGSFATDLGLSAGNIIVQTADFVGLDNNSQITSFSSGTGLGGNIFIETKRLSVLNGSSLFASVLGNQSAGQITINASESVEVTGSKEITRNVFSGSKLSIDTTGDGNAGNLTINTGSLIVRNGARVSTSTLGGNGTGGTLIVNASKSVEVTGTTPDKLTASEIASNTGGNGDAGNIRISTGKLIVRDGSRVSSFTTLGSNGQAGAVEINASKSVEVSGMRPVSLIPSSLDTSSDGTGAAGNLFVVAPSILLDNRGSLAAQTTAGKGNINLQAKDLIARRGSKITTNAIGTFPGGNIAIDTATLAALENSDITANAEEATGGRVIINARGIFGTAFRQNLTRASDITATSRLGPQFSGTVQLNTPDADPSRGLVPLQVNVVDPDRLIAQNPCTQGRGSQFIVTGKGGLPPSPSDAPNQSAVKVDLVEPATPMSTEREEQKIRSEDWVSKTIREERTIVPAQGWTIDDRGKVTLTAYDPMGKGVNRPLQRPETTCPPKASSAIRYP